MRSEAVQLVIALASGFAVATALLGGIGSDELWRLVVLPVALLLIVHGLLRLITLGRAEFRREPSGARAYLGVVARFVTAYLIVAAASA